MSDAGRVRPSTRAQSEHLYDVVVLGSTNLDLVARVDQLPQPGETISALGYSEHPGGKGLNQAVAARRAGADTAFITCVGSDNAGASLHRLIVSEGIAACVREVADPTGRAMICVDSSAENSIVVVPGANARLDIGVVDDNRHVLENCRVVLSQLEVPVESVAAGFAIARNAGARTILNPAPSRELDRDLLQLCDVVMPNQHELGNLGGASTLLDSGVRAVVITLGARGIRIVTREGDIDVPPFAVRAVDTTGAGDAACGAFAAALAHGSDLAYAARRASAAGALAATREGAVPSLPYSEEVDALVD
jgi:ribokinase